MSADVLGALLKAQTEGKVMWISVRGRSMRPLLTGGESLKVLRCTPQALQRGEIAVMLDPAGQLIAHLVVHVDPLRTESFSGVPDQQGLEVLARAVAVRRGTRVVPLPRPARFALAGLQRAWVAARHSAPTRGLHSALAGLVSSELTAGVRAVLGRIEVDLLGPDDLKEFSIELSRWTQPSAATLEALLREGVVVGARRRARLVGCLCIGADQVLRYGYLQRRAQGLGLEVVMIDRVLRAAEARGLKPERAELDPSQPGFIAAAQGFALS